MGAGDIIKNILIWTVLLLLLPLPLLILFLYKSVITIIATLTVSNLTSFKASDAMVSGDLVYTAPQMNLGPVCKIDGRLDVNQVRQLFQAKLLDPKLPNGEPRNLRLYTYIHRFGGYNFLRAVDVDKFKVEEHITEESLSQQPGQSEAEAVSEFIKKFYYSPHTYGKPLWKAAVVHLNDQQSMFFFCINHSIADGYSVLYLFDELTGTKSPVLTTPFGETLWDKVKLIAGAPSTMINSFGAVGKAPKPTQCSGVNTVHHYAFGTLELAKVKSIRKQAGTHVYPILLTILGGVLRRLLVQKGKYKSEEELPAHVYVPSPVAWPSHPRNQICNEWSVGGFKLPMKNPDRMARLLETEQHYNQVFDLGVEKIMKRVMVPLMSLFPASMGEALADPNSDMPWSTVGWNAIPAGSDYKLLGHSIGNIYLVVGHTHPKMTWISTSISHSNKMEVATFVNSEFVDNCSEFNQILNPMMMEELDGLLDDCTKAANGKG